MKIIKNKYWYIASHINEENEVFDGFHVGMRTGSKKELDNWVDKLIFTCCSEKITPYIFKIDKKDWIENKWIDMKFIKHNIIIVKMKLSRYIELEEKYRGMNVSFHTKEFLLNEGLIL
jgi:hypothetical protein